MLTLVADRVMNRAKIHSVHPMASPSRRRTSRHSTPAAKTGSVIKNRAKFSRVTARGDHHEQNTRQLLPVEPQEFCRRGRGGLTSFRCRSRGTMGLRLRELPGLSFHQLVQRDAEHLRELYQSVGSGTLPSVSHLLTDCLETPSCSAEGVPGKVPPVCAAAQSAAPWSMGPPPLRFSGTMIPERRKNVPPRGLVNGATCPLRWEFAIQKRKKFPGELLRESLFPPLFFF